MYKTVIIGVGGGRAHGHADAYQYVKRGMVAAVCDIRPEPLRDFADKYDVQATYTDYREMFEQEKPDLAHVSTPPHVRLAVLEAAEAAGVPAVAVEKPLAIQGEDYLALRDFAARKPKLKVAINHQLQFHPRRLQLQKLVAEGAIGDIRFIEASSGMNLAYQGTHSLQAIGAFNPATPTTVFGQVSGAAGLQPNDKEHYAPDQSLAAVEYSNGVQASLRCGENAPRVPRGDAIYQHKRIAVYGMSGYVHWTMWGWETFINGEYDSGEHEYPEEDVLGQAGLTEAMFDWLEDDNFAHPLNLERALVDFNVILALYASSLNHKVIALPYQPEANLVAKLRDALQD